MTKLAPKVSGSSNRRTSKENTEKTFRSQVSEIILERYGSRSSASLASIVSEIAKELGCPKHIVIDAIRDLERSGEIRVEEKDTFLTLGSYSFSSYSNWFWVSLIATFVSLGLVFVTSGFALYLRYFFGSLLILFLPGYSIVELLYARRDESQNKEGDANLAMILALSVGLSLVLAPSIVLILNYTPIGITLIPLALSLSAISLVCLTFALARKYEQYKLRRYAAELT
jgi:hypothetical protein